MRARTLFTIGLWLAMLVAGCNKTSPTAATAITTQSEEWSTTVYPGGSVSRTFTASEAGTVVVTLITTGPPVGFGVGIPPSSGVGCRISAFRVDLEGATLSVPVEPGSYCVSVYDPGTLTLPLGFRLRIDYP